MTTLNDEQLLEHADRVKGKVLLITGMDSSGSDALAHLSVGSCHSGAANGIGREAALLFAKHGCVPQLL